MAQNILRNFGRELPKEPSLFQNLSTDLAEVIKSLFLFIALVAILFDVGESFEQFGRGSPKKHSCIIISKSIFFFRKKSRLKVFLF